MLSLEGTQLGNYDVIRRMRVGGMGAVYEGRQRTAFGRRVAIKVILGDYASDRDMRRRFAREARTIAGLHHPHILPLIEFGDESGILYLVMPFIDGGTLTSYLRHHLLDLGEVAALYQQLLDAVEYAHDHKLIHRDIKSSNVLLEMRRNAAPYAYLADFGLVRTMRQGDPSQEGKPIPLEQVPGTPHYMAPEQTVGIVTPLTDIYALGVLLYQMLTGNLPYNDPDEVRVIKMHLHDPIPSPCDYDASIPIELDEVVRVAMSKLPEERYQSVAQLREAFNAALKEPSFSYPPDSEEGTAEVLPPIESVDAAPIELQLETLPTPEPIKKPPMPTVKLRPPETGEPAPQKRLTKTLKQYPTEQQPRPIIMQSQRLTGERAPAIEDSGEDPTIALRERRDPGERVHRTERAESYNTYDRYESFDRTPHRGRAGRGRAYVTTETFQRPRTPRNTDEPLLPLRRRRRNRLPLLVVVVVVLLLALLLLPRILGLNVIPSTVPLIGASPIATIRITVKQKVLQNTFLLTASPQVQSPNLNAHTIPDRVLQSTAENSSTVATTGHNTSKGNTASGSILFLNQNDHPVQVSKGLILRTHSGQQVQLTQDVTVQPKQGNQLGKAIAPAMAVQPGAAGNIAANDVSGTCCQPMLFTSNSAPFTGGSDPTNARFVTQSDITNAQKALTTQLEQQLVSQFQQQVGAGETMVNPPQYHVVAIADNSVNAQTDHVSVTVKVSASAMLYKKDVAIQTAMVLLNRQATNELGSDYQLQGKQSLASFTTEAGDNNIAYVKVSVSGTWAYNFTEVQAQKLRDPIRGATRDVAITYIESQKGVGKVDIQLPFGTDHLPDSTNNIDILLEPQPQSGD